MRPVWLIILVYLHMKMIARELTPAYLDYNAMVNHHFLERNEQFLQYRLIFDRRRTVHITLPAPAFFDYQEKNKIYYNQGGGERV